MADQQDFPTMEQVEKANKIKLARWYRFAIATTSEQLKILRRVARRFRQMGGMTPQLSKKIGH